MLSNALLQIHLAPSPGRPAPGELLCNSFRGESETLLHWLETQLGLLRDTPHQADRIMELVLVLEESKGSVFAKSFNVDRWGTARELLARVEQLRLAGWDGKDSPKLPPLVRDLSRLVKSNAFKHDTRSRLDRVMKALDNGQTLPEHQVYLWNSPDSWPAAWRPVLAQLSAGLSPKTTPLAPSKSALRAVQEHLLFDNVSKTVPDASLRVCKARSIQTACEAVAKSLAAIPELIPHTIVLCESDSAALCLDASLAQLGLPTMGAQKMTLSHPVLQVLPLAIRLCWEPVAPELLMDFLALPVSPIPRHAARTLANALSSQPGLGSRAWESAWAELVDPKNDEHGRNGERLPLWLEMNRIPLGNPLPSELVADICLRTTNWAAAYAWNKDRGEEPEPGLAQALRALASQAAMLRKLVQTQEVGISEPQLVRLLESAQSRGLTVKPNVQSFGGPILVRSLAEILHPTKRMIWLGLSTEDHEACRWTVKELQALVESGVDLDDGTRALVALREAERRGFSRIQESVLALKLPGDEERKISSIWLQIEHTLKEKDDYPCPSLENFFDGSAADSIDPWAVPSKTFSITIPQPPRPLWAIPHDLLHEREQCSASSLQSRLACPLKWVFNYQAYIRPSRLASLPGDFQLKGLFCHTCLEYVFGHGGELPSPDRAANLVGAFFDQRLPFDAAPLAAPHRASEMREVRSQLLNATRTFAAALISGGYRVHGTEVSTQDSTFDGRVLNSLIDCLAVRDDGQEAVIDFKFSGYKLYRTILEEGKAVQLALYAYARSQQNGGHFPAVGYLILDRGVFYTLEGSRIQGDASLEIVDGQPIREVWSSFVEALQSGDNWLYGTESVPARPLQELEDRPAGCSLVIEEPSPSEDQIDKSPCKYCDYKVLCGIKELL